MKKLLDISEANSIIEKINSEYHCNFNPCTTIITHQPLSFYPEYRLLNITDYSSVPYERSIAIFGFNRFQFLDFTNKPIYEFNRRVKPILTKVSAHEYVRFFFSLVRTKKGRFIIVETPKDIHWLDLHSCFSRELQDIIKPIALEETKENTFTFSAYIAVKDSLFRARIIVKSNGSVSLTDEELVIKDIPIIDDFVNSLDYSYPELNQAPHVIRRLRHLEGYDKKAIENNTDISQLFHLGNAYLDIGQYDRSINIHQKCTAIYKTNNFKIGEAYSLLKTAIALRCTDNINDAIEAMAKSMIIFEDSNKIPSDLSKRFLTITRKHKLHPMEFFFKYHFGGSFAHYSDSVESHIEYLFKRYKPETGGFLNPDEDFIYDSLRHFEPQKHTLSNSAILNDIMRSIVNRNDMYFTGLKLMYFFVGCTLEESEPALSTFQTDEHFGHIIELEVRLLKAVRDIVELYCYYIENDIYDRAQKGDMTDLELINFSLMARAAALNFFLYNENNVDYMSPRSLKNLLKDWDSEAIQGFCMRIYDFIICHELAHHSLGHTHSHIPHSSLTLNKEEIDHLKEKLSEHTVEEIDADIMGLSLYLGEEVFYAQKKQTEVSVSFFLPIYLSRLAFSLLLQEDYRAEKNGDISEKLRMSITIGYVHFALERHGIKIANFEEYEDRVNLFCNFMLDLRRKDKMMIHMIQQYRRDKSALLSLMQNRT